MMDLLTEFEMFDLISCIDNKLEYGARGNIRLLATQDQIDMLQGLGKYIIWGIRLTKEEICPYNPSLYELIIGNRI